MIVFEKVILENTIRTVRKAVKVLQVTKDVGRTVRGIRTSNGVTIENFIRNTYTKEQALYGIFLGIIQVSNLRIGNPEIGNTRIGNARSVRPVLVKDGIVNVVLTFI